MVPVFLRHTEVPRQRWGGPESLQAHRAPHLVSKGHAPHSPPQHPAQNHCYRKPSFYSSTPPFAGGRAYPNSLSTIQGEKGSL